MYKACKNEGNLFTLLNQESFFELLGHRIYIIMMNCYLLNKSIFWLAHDHGNIIGMLKTWAKQNTYFSKSNYSHGFVANLR